MALKYSLPSYGLDVTFPFVNAVEVLCIICNVIQVPSYFWQEVLLGIVDKSLSDAKGPIS